MYFRATENKIIRESVLSIMVCCMSLVLPFSEANAEAVQDSASTHEASQDTPPKVTYSKEPVGLVGKICSVEYLSGKDPNQSKTIDFYFTGIDYGKIQVRTVVRTGSERKVSDDLTFTQALSPENQCVLEPVPGKKLLLWLNRFNELEVSELNPEQ